MNSTPGRPERRQAQRLQVALRVELSKGTGLTRDLSVCGVYFETDQTFVLGESIEFTLVLEYLAPGQPVCLTCRGRVVRIERHDSTIGVGVAITAYRFERCADIAMESSDA